MILPTNIAKIYGLEEAYDESKHSRDEAGKFSGKDKIKHLHKNVVSKYDELLDKHDGKRSFSHAGHKIKQDQSGDEYHYVDHVARVKDLRTKQDYVDPEVLAHYKKKYKKFSGKAGQIVTIPQKGGALHVDDGNHRIRALKAMGHGNKKVKVRVRVDESIPEVSGLAERTFDETKVKRDAGKFSKTKGAEAASEEGHGFKTHPNATVDGILGKMVELGIVDRGNRKQMLATLKDQYQRQKAKGFPEAKLFKAAFKHVKGVSGGSSATPATTKPNSPEKGAGSETRRTVSGAKPKAAGQQQPSLLQRGARLLDRAGANIKQRVISGAKYGAKLAKEHLQTGQSKHQNQLSQGAFDASAAVKSAKGTAGKMKATAAAHAAHKKAALVAKYYGDMKTAKQHAGLANAHAKEYKSMKPARTAEIAKAKGAPGTAFVPSSWKEKPKAPMTGPTNSFIPDSWKKKGKKMKEELESFLSSLYETYDESKHKRDEGGRFATKSSAFKASKEAWSASNKLDNAKTMNHKPRDLKKALDLHQKAYDTFKLARMLGHKKAKEHKNAIQSIGWEHHFRTHGGSYKEVTPETSVAAAMYMGQQHASDKRKKEVHKHLGDHFKSNVGKSGKEYTMKELNKILPSRLRGRYGVSMKRVQKAAKLHGYQAERSGVGKMRIRKKESE